MNTRHLEEFLLFAEKLNYSTAAKKLYITRPTLSEHLGELEADLGCKLINRQQARPSLTPAGKRFIQTATSLLETIDSIKQEYQGLAENLLVVSVAATNLPWLESVLYKARRNIQQAYPSKHIEIVSVSGPLSTIEALLDGSNDIVIAGFKQYQSESERISSYAGIQGFKVRTEEIKLLITQGNPLFNRKVIALSDLDGYTITLPPDIFEAYKRDNIVERFRQKGANIALSPAQVSDHFEYFAYDFGNSIGVVPTTLIPRFGMTEREECRMFSLEELPLYTDFYLAYKDEFIQTENGRLLVNEIQMLVSQNSDVGEHQLR